MAKESKAPEYTLPLKKEEEWRCAAQQEDRRYGAITGTVFSDRAGVVYIEQSPDGTNFDLSESYEVAANVGQGFYRPAVAEYWRVRFVVGSAGDQTVFRIEAGTREV